MNPVRLSAKRSIFLILHTFRHFQCPWRRKVLGCGAFWTGTGSCCFMGHEPTEPPQLPSWPSNRHQRLWWLPFWGGDQEGFCGVSGPWRLLQTWCGYDRWVISFLALDINYWLPLRGGHQRGYCGGWIGKGGVYKSSPCYKALTEPEPSVLSARSLLRMSKCTLGSAELTPGYPSNCFV